MLLILLLIYYLNEESSGLRKSPFFEDGETLREMGKERTNKQEMLFILTCVSRG